MECCFQIGVAIIRPANLFLELLRERCPRVHGFHNIDHLHGHIPNINIDKALCLFRKADMRHVRYVAVLKYRRQSG